MNLFTSFHGRIPLSRFWIGHLTLIALAIPVGFLIGLVAGDATSFRIGAVALWFALLYPILAITTRRLHDRNKSALVWIPIFWGPAIVGQIAGFLGFDLASATLNGTQMVPNPIGIAFSLIAFVFAVWALVELGFLKGSDGPNRFGPDPYQQ